MVTFAFRNLFRHKGRTAMTLAALSLGVVTLVLSGGFVEDVYVQLRDTTIHSRLGFLQVYRQGYYVHGRRAPYTYMIDRPDEILRELEKLPGVVEILKRTNFSGLLNNGRTDYGIVAEGVEPSKEVRLGDMLSIIDGKQIENDSANEMLIGEGVARALALAPGDTITLIANTTDGAMNSVELEVAGIFRSFSKQYDARAVRVPLEVSAQLIDSSSVHALVFSLERADLTDSVVARAKALLPASDFEVMSWLELDDFYTKTRALYERQFSVLQLIILGIVLLSVANSVNMTVNERAGEFGTLRALGRPASYIFRLIVLENALLALVGSALGVGIGVLLGWVISEVGIPMPPPPNSNVGYTAHVRLLPTVLLSAFTVGFSATILSAMLAARGATRTAIVDALRQTI